LYLKGIRNGKARKAVTKYTGAHYTQYSTGVKDGVEGFVEFFDPFIAKYPKRDIQIVRAIEDGQYVFLHAYKSFNAGEAEWVTSGQTAVNFESERYFKYKSMLFFATSKRYSPKFPRQMRF